MLAWRLAQKRLRRHPIYFISQSLSITIAVLTLLAIQTISSSSQANLAQVSLNQLSAGDRYITLSSNRVIGSISKANEIGAFLRNRLRGSIESSTTQELLFHQISDQHGKSAYFGGVDLLSEKTAIISGRQPRICHVSQCEVLQIGENRSALQMASRLGLTIVGSAKIVDSKLFSGTYAPEKGVTLLVANGVAGASSMSALSNFQGSNGWVASIDASSLRKEGTTHLMSNLLAFENDLSTRFSGLSLTWPSDALSQGQSQSQTLNQKLGILYYILVIIFLAFQIILVRLRLREVTDFHNGLGRIGARKKLIIGVHLLETAAPIATGLVLSTLLAALTKTFLLNEDSEFRIHPSALNVASIGSFVLFVLAVIFTARFVGTREWNSLLRFSVALTIFFAASTFATSRKVFGTELTSSFWLIALAYLLCSGISIFFFRLIAGIWRKKQEPTFVIAQEGMRTWQGVCAILGISIALTTSAFGYQTKVETDLRAAVTEQVPLDLLLRVGPALSKPLDIQSLNGYTHLIANSNAWSILRLGGTVRNQGTGADALPIVGISPNLLPQLPVTTFHNLESVIAAKTKNKTDEVPLGSARTISITLRGVPKVIDVVGWFRTPLNSHRSVMSNDHADVRTILLPKEIPVGSTLIGLEFHETSEYLSRRLHALGEGQYSVPMIKGSGQITAMSFDGKAIEIENTQWLFGKFPFEFDGGSVYLRPSLPEEMPRVITDPMTAALAQGSILTLSAVSQDNFKVKIGAVRTSFPSAGNRFVIMDLDALQNIVAQNSPGAIDPTEVWISTPKPLEYTSILNTFPYSGLERVSRLEIEVQARAEPSRRGLKAAYLIGIGYALLLSLLVLIGVPLLFLKEKSSLIRYLEIQGVPKIKIRSGVRRVILFLLLVGLASGSAIGLLLIRIAGR